MVKKRFVAGGISIIMSVLVHLYGQPIVASSSLSDSVLKIPESEVVEEFIEEEEEPIVEDDFILEDFVPVKDISTEEEPVIKEEETEEEFKLIETEIVVGAEEKVKPSFDLNLDGKVDFLDMSIFEAYKNAAKEKGVSVDLIDYNNDGEINEKDEELITNEIEKQESKQD